MSIPGERPSSNDSFNNEVQSLHDLSRFQDKIASTFEGFYATNPALAEFSERTANTLAGGTFDGLDQPDAYPHHPASEQIHRSYKRLIFAFTNPEDFEDRADDNAMLEFVSRVTSETPDEEVELQVLASRLEIISATILGCFLILNPGDELKGKTPAQQFQFVQEYYQFLLLAIPDGDERK